MYNYRCVRLGHSYSTTRSGGFNARKPSLEAFTVKPTMPAYAPELSIPYHNDKLPHKLHHTIILLNNIAVSLVRH